MNSSFTYDSLNRFSGVNYPGMGKAYTMQYDEYGNRWSQTYTQGSGTNQSFLFDQTTNRLVSTLGSASNTPWNIGYDGNGNQTNDTLHSYSYDTDNNVTQVDGGNTATYDYDAMKHRRMKQSRQSVRVTAPVSQTHAVSIRHPRGQFNCACRNVRDGRVLMTQVEPGSSSSISCG